VDVQSPESVLLRGRSKGIFQAQCKLDSGASSAAVFLSYARKIGLGNLSEVSHG